MPFEFLDEIATADVAFRAWGASLEEMMVSAAEATMNVMVAELDTIDPVVQSRLRVHSYAVDMLLFELLQELIFEKDAHKLLLRIREPRISREGDELVLEAESFGERLDPHRHDLVVDVKAVTLHKFSVEQTPSGWEATVILDI